MDERRRGGGEGERESGREKEEARVRIDLTSLPKHSVRIKQATVADVVLDDADVHVFVSRIFGGCPVGPISGRWERNAESERKRDTGNGGRAKGQGEGKEGWRRRDSFHLRVGQRENLSFESINLI